MQSRIPLGLGKFHVVVLVKFKTILIECTKDSRNYVGNISEVAINTSLKYNLKYGNAMLMTAFLS